MNTALDPTGATAAYLAKLPKGAVETAAHYTQGSHWVLVIGKLAAVVACLIILRSGILPRIAAMTGSRNRQNFAVFATGFAALLLQALLLMPWTFYADLVRERSYGLSNLTTGAWLTQSFITAVAGALVGGLLFIPLYVIIRRAKQRWWMWSSALLALLIALATVFAPYAAGLFNRYEPLQPGVVHDVVTDLARQASLSGEEIVIYDGSKQTDRYTASVTGVGGTARIALSDTVMRDPVDIPAIRAVVAHEIGHYKHHHLLILAGAVALLSCIGLIMAAFAFPTALRLLGGGGVGGISDASGIPVLLAISAVFTLVTTPVVNTVMRLVERDADAYGLNLAREPDGAARALLATTSYRAPSPSRLEEVIFYDHPSIESRLRVAMEWKAAAQGR
ncbi:M48 family metalloprotease [Sphingomonas xinjiangensis]|uniref:STE24 endopeptidase n=1 Tax=Sphingomonas xinjiangensis TaxID=643568 RepID=A0A840YNI3_9SPHN|nr:M48 family metalloprotease [Sphingomonas xinjiangensis]MBB5711816.1 STE24 endopeptidase [Sphingomonas xinjiangensis]